MSTYHESNIKNCSVWLCCDIEADNTDGSVNIVLVDGERISSVPPNRVRLNGNNSKFLPMRYDLVKSCLKREKVKSVPPNESQDSLVESPTPSESAQYDMNQAQKSTQLGWQSNAFKWMSSYANSALRCELNLSTTSPTSAMRQLQSSSCGTTPPHMADDSSEGEEVGSRYNTQAPFASNHNQQPHPTGIHRPIPIHNSREAEGSDIEDMRRQLQGLEQENTTLKSDMAEMSRQFSLMAATVADMKRIQDRLIEELCDKKDISMDDLRVV